MHVAPFDDLGRGADSRRESPSRRIGVILSVLFLTSVGMAATFTSARAGAQDQAEGPVAVTATATR